MDQALKVIKEQIAIVEKILEGMRADFDRTDANHPYAQVQIANDIACAAAKLDTLKHLYKILGGV
jgi:hypothetical protein